MGLSRDDRQKGKPVLHGTHEDDNAEDRTDNKLEREIFYFFFPCRGYGVFAGVADDAQEFVTLIGDDCF